MKKLFTLLLIIFCIQAKAQQPTKTGTLQGDEMVLTPKGLRPKSTVHHIESGYHLSMENGYLKKVHTKTGKIVQDYGEVPMVPMSTNTEKKSSNKISAATSTTYGSAWVTYAWWQNNSANPISYFSTNWIVPTAPTTNNYQTIFLFNGIDPSATGDAILQPVLQWGYSAAGGGPYWAITNWYVTSTNSFWGDSLITVTPGTPLQGIMVLTAQSDSGFSYNSSFTGYPNCSLQVNNLTELRWANETMEVYNITAYSDYPPDTAVSMSSVVMNTGSVSAPLHWTIADISTEVGQHTLVPSNSSTNGDVDLYFHYPNRAGIVSISTNASSCSDTTINPIALLQYHGGSVLTTCILNYQVDAGAVQTYTWNGSLTTAQTTNVNLPSLHTSAGAHTLTCYCSSANDSTNAYFLDSQSSATFHIVSTVSLPLLESFETTTCPSGVLPNTNWNISHAAITGGVDFSVTSTAAATGANSCMINNLNNVAGDTSIIQTTTAYDITTLTTPVLSFKAAYQQRSTANNDKLQVFTSTDCGNSWQSRRVITSATLASLAGGVGASVYTPTSAQFTTYTVNINAVANSHNVMFRWEFISGSSIGNDLYIDDINVNSNVTGIEQYSATNAISVYPNPTNGILYIEGLLQNNNLTICDVLGNEMITTKEKQIDVSNLSNGLYFIKTHQGISKFIKQ